MKVKILALGMICFFAFSCASFEVGNLNPKGRRADYIAAHVDSLDEHTAFAISEGVLVLGMTESEVVASIGKPYKVNRSVNAGGEHVQWVMFPHNSYRDRRFWLVYFDKGLVSGWDSK